jgi:predicted  nucleic acid-binding Zn-ribbon protein
MISEASSRAGLHPSIVLSAYVEPLVRGRRVAILGDATIGLADELSQRGARLVHVYDPDAARTAEALARAAPGRPHQVSYAVLEGDLGVRDGAFDVVMVPDLSIFVDAADTLRRARRLCAQTGVAVFVAPNASGAGKKLLPAGHRPERGGAPGERTLPLGYYELFDLVSLQFAKVRMVGQAPFVGYTVADFAPRGEPEVSVDTSLLATSEEPEHFIAIASDRPVTLDAYAVIELPWHDVADALVPSEASLSVRTGERLALAEAQARVALLTAEMERLRDRADEQAREAESNAPVAAALAARVAELEGELAAAGARLADEREARDLKLREVEGRAGDNHVRAERLTNQIRDLDEELRGQRDRGTKLTKLLDDEKRARQKAELDLGMVRGSGGKERVDALATELAVARAQIADLELQLVETRRRPPVQPAPVSPPPPPPMDPKLLFRLGELEQAVNAALREAAEAASQRDAALDRIARADARLGSLSAVEAQLDAARAEKVALEGRAARLSAQVTEVERRILAERARSSAAEDRAADGAQRLVTAERHAAEASNAAADLAERLALAEKATAEVEARLAEQDARFAALGAELADAQRRAAAAGDDRSAVEAAAAEIAALEGALRARGHVVSALERDLRESARIGKELLGELEAAHVWNGNGASHTTTGGDDLRGQLDALAQGAARTEADLQAAAWRIAQLERELASRGEPGDPSMVQVELEQALAAARDEVASLRRALGSSPS